MQTHGFDGLSVGLIRWPTSICTSNDPNVLFVLAARRVIRLSLRPLMFTDITGQQFFNACAITFAGDRRLIVAEHVFGADISPAGIGVLWAVDVETGARQIIKAGVKLGQSLAFLCDRKSIVATQLSTKTTWELIEIGIDDGKPLRSAGPFRGRAAFVMIDDDTAIVSTELEYEGFHQPFLLRARLKSLSDRRTEA